MTVIVQADVSLGLAKGQNRTVFRNPRGNKLYYAFYIDRAIIGFGDRVVYERSTDGLTWGTAVSWFDAGGSDTNDTLDSFDIKFNDTGSQLEVYIVGHFRDDSTGNSITRYGYGWITDASTSINWYISQTIDSAITSEMAGPHCIVLARTDNGRIVVAFTEDLTNKGKDYRLTKLIGSDGDEGTPSWSGETLLLDPSSSTNNQNKDEVWFGLESYSSNYPDQTFLYARFPYTGNTTGYRVNTVCPDWDGSSFTNITLGGVWGVTDAYVGEVISGLIDEADIAHLFYHEYSSSDWHIVHRKAGTAGDDDLGTATNVLSGAAGGWDALTCTLDTGPSPNELYVFAPDSSQDLQYRITPVDTIAFGPEYVMSYHYDMDQLSSWSRTIENSIHLAGENTNLDDVFYNEIPAYLATSTTLADLVFPDQNYYLGPHSV